MVLGGGNGGTVSFEEVEAEGINPQALCSRPAVIRHHMYEDA